MSLLADIITGKEACFRVDAFLEIDVPWCTKGKSTIEGKARLNIWVKYIGERLLSKFKTFSPSKTLWRVWKNMPCILQRTLEIQ